MESNIRKIQKLCAECRLELNLMPFAQEPSFICKI
jgi:hypothetical protein